MSISIVQISLRNLRRAFIFRDIVENFAKIY